MKHIAKLIRPRSQDAEIRENDQNAWVADAIGISAIMVMLYLGLLIPSL